MLQAALLEAANEGYALIQMTSITSSVNNYSTYSEGVLLVFELKLEIEKTAFV